MSKGTRESKATRQRRYRAKQKAHGICIRCCAPLTSHMEGCLQRHNDKNNLLYANRRLIIFDRLGNKCACCGESIKDFLTIDHVNNTGNVERKNIGQRSFYAKLAKNNESDRDYQLLCWNCNSTKMIFGYCAHTHDFENEQISPQTRWYRKLKAEVIKHYGNVCVCCGESFLWFLTINHVGGGGRAERSNVGTGSAFYRWLKKTGMPEGYDVKCFNCNCSSGVHGSCPHNR